MSDSSALLALPAELLLLTIQELPKADLLNFGLTCRFLNSLSSPHVLRQISQEMKSPQCEGQGQRIYIHRLVVDCSHDLLQLLLSHDPPLDRKDTAGETALHVAARKGCLRCVQILLHYGAHHSPLSRWAWTPLMVAVREGHAEVAAALIIAGADTSIRGFHGRTALHMVGRFRQWDVTGLIKGTGGMSEIVRGNEVSVGK